jgi:hypothetical protein
MCEKYSAREQTWGNQNVRTPASVVVALQQLPDVRRGRPAGRSGGAIARGSGISVRELLAPGGVVRSRYAALHEWPTCEHTKAASGPRMS